jgi:hypothetical protein
LLDRLATREASPLYFDGCPNHVEAAIVAFLRTLSDGYPL